MLHYNINYIQTKMLHYTTKSCILIYTYVFNYNSTVANNNYWKTFT